MIIITNDKLVPNNHTIIIIIIIIIVIIIMITIVKVFKRQGTPPSKKKVFLWVLHDVPITPYAMFLKKKKLCFFMRHPEIIGRCLSSSIVLRSTVNIE